MRSIVCAMIVVASIGGAAACLPPAPLTVGFGVGIPLGASLEGGDSFSFLQAEALVSPGLTAYGELGVYPASFPDAVEGGLGLLAKAWFASVAPYVGAGVSVRGHRIGSAWSLVPLVQLRGGVQLWVDEALAFQAQIRTLDAFPLDWSFTPEVSLGLALALGRGRPETPRAEFDVLWLLVGLATAALVAFLPRS
ncbi:MAG: hypothetical protein AB1778_08055 [Candidatus Bipolaricaulota bacterium]